MPEKNISFEEAYSSLEKISEQLNRNNLPLDEAIALYEEGIKLSKYCSDALDKAKQKIKKLQGDEN